MLLTSLCSRRRRRRRRRCLPSCRLLGSPAASARSADDSKVLLSAAGDSSARLWSMEDGAELFRFRFNEPARACKFSVGERLAAISTDPFMNSVSAIRVFNIAEDIPSMQQVRGAHAAPAVPGIAARMPRLPCWAVQAAAAAACARVAADAGAVGLQPVSWRWRVPSTLALPCHPPTHPTAPPSDGPRRGAEPDGAARPHHAPALDREQPAPAVVQRGRHGAPAAAAVAGLPLLLGRCPTRQASVATVPAPAAPAWTAALPWPEPGTICRPPHPPHALTHRSLRRCGAGTWRRARCWRRSSCTRSR